MAEPRAVAPQTQTAPISSLQKPTREKSQETILKQTMRRINKDLEKLNKLVAEFEELEKAYDNSQASRTSLQKELEITKTELIKLLGLG